MKARRHSRPACVDCGSPMVRVPAAPGLDIVLARVPQWQWEKILARPLLRLQAQKAINAGDVLAFLEVAEVARLAP